MDCYTFLLWLTCSAVEELLLAWEQATLRDCLKGNMQTFNAVLHCIGTSHSNNRVCSTYEWGVCMLCCSSLRRAASLGMMRADYISIKNIPDTALLLDAG